MPWMLYISSSINHTITWYIFCTCFSPHTLHISWSILPVLPAIALIRIGISRKTIHTGSKRQEMSIKIERKRFQVSRHYPVYSYISESLLHTSMDEYAYK